MSIHVAMKVKKKILNTSMVFLKLFPMEITDESNRIFFQFSETRFWFFDPKSIIEFLPYVQFSILATISWAFFENFRKGFFEQKSLVIAKHTLKVTFGKTFVLFSLCKMNFSSQPQKPDLIPTWNLRPVWSAESKKIHGFIQILSAYFQNYFTFS